MKKNAMRFLQLRKHLAWIGLALLCCCIATVLPAQQNKTDSNLLYWAKDRRLTFEDFEAFHTTKDTIFIRVAKGAGIHRLGVLLSAIDVQVKTIRGKTTFTIRAVMDKSGSWIRSDGDTVSLKHEQGHFDICEIYARVLRRQIRKATSLARSKAIYEEVLAAESAEHAAFDRENTFEQGGVTKAWGLKIAQRLWTLKGFSNPVVVLAIDK